MLLQLLNLAPPEEEEMVVVEEKVEERPVQAIDGGDISLDENQPPNPKPYTVTTRLSLRGPVGDGNVFCLEQFFAWRHEWGGGCRRGRFCPSRANSHARRRTS
jgi:hypothetical protein